MAVPESGGAGKGSNGEAGGSGAVHKHGAVVRRAAGIASGEAKRSATADVRRAAGASGTVGYPDGGGRRDDEPVREELHGSGGDYNDPSKSKRVRGEPHVERALSAVFRGEETHVERVPSEEAKEAAKQWANGNQNVANNAFSSAPSKKRRNLAGHKKKVEQFRIEEYLTGIEEIDDDLRKLIGLFNQMIPLVKAAQEESLSQEGLSDVNREMKFATDEMRVLRKKINGKGGKAPIIPPQFLERYY
uniref:Uncharacterized protein n=1 Tax=Oryza rufipogon TaxID=4529 RepID=A0A0E0RJ86_ORYRU